MTSPRPHVIIGGGLAGAKAAEALRGEGHDGPVVLIAEEPELPYERPPLSKTLLRGESSPEEARVHPDGWYADHDVDLRTGTTVAEIDAAGRSVRLTDGERVGYDRLLIATGAQPRRLPLDGMDLDGVHTLRTVADVRTLRDAFSAGGRLAVVGAGWIGAEVAASARQLGLEVTLVEQAAAPLEGVLGHEVGELFADLHREHGVELLCESGLEAIEGDGRVERLRLAGGRSVDCDVVVVGVGVTPRTELAVAAGLEVGDGILVDAELRTSVPEIFAAGDVASVLHPFYGSRLRVEHWANALRQPEVAARAMLGKPARWDLLPYFFSDQYDAGMEYAGLADPGDRVVFRGDRAARELIAFWVRDDRVVAAMNLNVWDVTDDLQALIGSRRTVDIGQLEDPDVPLTELGG